MSFRIRALPAAPFAPLFSMSGDELRRRRAVRRVVDHTPGFPCRVSLCDAAVGETVVLLHYEHQPADTPFRAGHAIFVREGAVEATPDVGEVPELLQRRQLGVRAFDAGDMLIGGDTVDGRAIAPMINRFLADARVAYLHLHNTALGCYLARVDRCEG